MTDNKRHTCECLDTHMLLKHIYRIRKIRNGPDHPSVGWRLFQDCTNGIEKEDTCTSIQSPLFLSPQCSSVSMWAAGECMSAVMWTVLFLHNISCLCGPFLCWTGDKYLTIVVFVWTAQIHYRAWCKLHYSNYLLQHEIRHGDSVECGYKQTTEPDLHAEISSG